MKALLLCAMVLILFVIIGCNKEDLIGVEDVEVISHVQFTINEKIVSSTRLTVNGIIKNTGNKTIYPPWFIDGEFYSDSTFTFKLGGDKTKINYTLASNESTGWQLIFSSDQYIESDYPNFDVKNLRAFYEEEE